MDLLRSVRASDLDALARLASLNSLMNLPADRKLLARQIEISQASFRGAQPDPQQSFYRFVLEDDEGAVIGTSAIVGQHGTRQNPHVSFEILSEEKYAPDLDRYFKHRVLKLSFNYEGPSEVGSIIVDPAHRGAGRRLGRQLSYVRFLYMAAHPDRFRPTVVAEMLPPYVRDGWSPLWNALGQKFTGLSYTEADRLSHENKSFIQQLFPHEPIYVCLLPDDAAHMIAAVDDATVPALKMLEAIGFRYEDRVDPFDGGPHYRVERDQIAPIRAAAPGRLQAGADGMEAEPHLVGVEVGEGEFRAVRTPARVSGERVVAPPASLQRLGVSEDHAGMATPL